MKFIDFPQRNKLIGEEQPQYETLPAHINPADVEGGIYFCCEFDPDEWHEMSKTRRVWFKQLTFKQNFQPVNAFAKCPIPKHHDAFKIFLYRALVLLNGAEENIVVWNGTDEPAPEKIQYNGLTYAVLRTAKEPYYEGYNIGEEGNLFIGTFADKDFENLAEYGSRVLVEAGPEGQQKYFKLP